MAKRQAAWLIAAISVILASMLLAGCGGGTGPIASGQEHEQQQVGTEYFLQQAGFRKYQVNQNMPQQEALLSVLPRDR